MEDDIKALRIATTMTETEQTTPKSANQATRNGPKHRRRASWRRKNQMLQKFVGKSFGEKICAGSVEWFR